MSQLLDNYFGLIRNLLPNEESNFAFGLDIGSSEMKAVILTKTVSGYDVSQTFHQSVVNNEFNNAFDRLKRTIPTDISAPFVGIGGRGTLIRHIMMPKMNLDDLRNALNFEADKYFPFPQEQIFTDCVITDEAVSGNQIGVMAVASKKDLVNERLELMAQQELMTDFVGFNSIALANHIQHWGQAHPDDMAQTAYLDIGDSVSHLQIFNDGQPVFNRDVLIGGGDIIKSVCNAFGVKSEEARDLIKEPGASKVKLVSAMESVVGNLAYEVKLSFDYFSTGKDLKVKKLYVTGGGSLIDGLLGLLTKEVDVDVEPWDFMDTLNLNVVFDDDQKNEFRAKFAVAVGLALYYYD